MAWLRDGLLSKQVSPTLQQEISQALQAIQPFLDAKDPAKVEQIGDLQKWKREKFDNTFGRYIHRYLLSLRTKTGFKANHLEEFVYRDLHFLTTKYLELLGSVEFNAYMTSVLNQRLNLSVNGPFQAFLVDLMVNSLDFSNQYGRLRALALEKFAFLILHLDNPSFYLQFEDIKKMYLRDLEMNLVGVPTERLVQLLQDPQFMLNYSIVSLAKNHNFFGQIDTYMKELARIALTLPAEQQHLVRNLEEALSAEVAILTQANLIDALPLAYKSA